MRSLKPPSQASSPPLLAPSPPSPTRSPPLFLAISNNEDRELSEAQAEIKALRLSERLREKAVEELWFSA